MLREDPELKIINVRYQDDASLMADLANLFPDVIMLNEDGPVSSAHLFELLADWSFLIAIRIVVVRVADNRIDVLERRRIFANQVSDLTELLRLDPART